MMKIKADTFRRITAAVCAVTLVCGAAAGLPGDITGADTGALITACAEEPATVNTFEGASLSLEGDLALNFTVNVNAPDAVTHIVLTDGSEVKKFPLTGAAAEKVTWYVKPSEYGKQITLSLEKDGEPAGLYTRSGIKYDDNKTSCSVKDYITQLRAISTNPELLTLLDSLEGFCGLSAQKFRDGPAPSGVFMPELTADNMSKYAFQPTGDTRSDTGSVVRSHSLLLDSKTTYRVYFNSKPDSVTIDGAPAEIKQKETDGGTVWYSELANIPAHELGKDHTLAVDGSEYKFSAYSYVYSVLKSESSSQLLTDLSKSLFTYGFSADMYRQRMAGDNGIANAVIITQSTEDPDQYSFTLGFDYVATWSGSSWNIENSIRTTDTREMLAICEALNAIHPIEGRFTETRIPMDMALEWGYHNRGYNFLTTSQAVRLYLQFQADDAMKERYRKALDRLASVDLDKKDQGKTYEEFLEAEVGKTLAELIIRLGG